MDEQTATEEVKQYRDGEDWVNGGRAEFCPLRISGFEVRSLKWDEESGTVRCDKCGYVNPDATRDAVLFLISERERKEKLRVELATGHNFYSQQFYEIGKILGMPEEDYIDGEPLKVVEFARALVKDKDRLEDEAEKLNERVANAREAQKDAEDSLREVKEDTKAARAKSTKTKPAAKPVLEEAKTNG